MKKLNTFAKLGLATTMAFGSIAPVMTMMTPIHAQEEESQPAGMIDTHNIENMDIQCVGQLVYTGAPQEQKIKFMINNKKQKLTKDVDYTVDGNIATEAGTYTMTIRGINDFHGEVQVSFTIAQPEKPVTPTDNMWDTHNIENLDVRLANQLVANGKNQEQKIVISCSKDKTTLKEGVDYKLTNNSVAKAGNYTLIAKGINNYHGTIKVNFTVQQAAKTDIRNAKVTLANTLKEDGKNQTQKVKITYGDLILEEGVDYTLENNVAKNAGTYTMKIKAMGDLFTGETTAKFTIAAKEDKKEEKKEDKQENVEQAVEENHNGMVLGIAAIAVAAFAGIIAFLKKHAK